MSINTQACISHMRSHLQASAKLSAGHGHVVMSGEEKTPFGRRQRLVASVHVDSQPCAEILSWCLSHVVALCTSLHDFYGPWSDSSATSLAHPVCQCNRQVLHKPQHLHPSDPFLLPAMWRRLGSTNSRCMRSHCKSPVKQLRGGVHVRGLYSGFLEVAQILAKIAKKGTSNARQERISTTATCRRFSHVSMLLLGSQLRFRVCRAARNTACRRQARSDGIR